jgi:PAS domain-containing protein
VPTRFALQINHLRAGLRGKYGTELLTALRQHLDAIEVPALAADNSSRYIAANNAARELTGFFGSELSPPTLTDLLPFPRPSDRARLWEDFVAHGFQRGESELHPTTGRSVRVNYWAYASVAPGVHVFLLTPVAAEQTV